MIYDQFKQEIISDKKQNQSYSRAREERLASILISASKNNSDSLRLTLNDPEYKEAVHFYVTDCGVIQMLDTHYFAYRGGDARKSIVIEVMGFWENSADYWRPYQWTMKNKDQILTQLVRLFEVLLADHPQLTLIYESDAHELKSKGYAKKAFNKAKNNLLKNTAKPQIFTVDFNKAELQVIEDSMTNNKSLEGVSLKAKIKQALDYPVDDSAGIIHLGGRQPTAVKIDVKHEESDELGDENQESTLKNGVSEMEKGSTRLEQLKTFKKLLKAAKRNVNILEIIVNSLSLKE